MQNLANIVISEIALEGPYGIQWSQLVDRVAAALKSIPFLVSSAEDLESVKNLLTTEGIIELGRGNHWILTDSMRRYQALGVSTLPLVYESAQSLRILELVARGRQCGNWSFNLCSALHVDPKQLFHLSSVLVEAGLVNRFSSIAVPKRYKSCTSATNATFFILTRYCSSMDADLADVVDPSHSTDTVTTLIMALLREAGGVMLTASLRATVVLNGGFTAKQFKRGKDRLVSLNRIESILIPKTSDEEDDEDTKNKDYLQGVRIIDSSTITVPDEMMKEEEIVSEEEIFSCDKKTILAQSLIRSNIPFRDAIVYIIKLGSGVTSTEIAALTGCKTKEVLKALETIRAGEGRIQPEWRNEGKRKFLVYNWAESVEELTAQITVDQKQASTGYVTTATVRRSGLARTIVADRVALSLIDLGRAIEAAELAAGTGVPGVQIDRRTLKKICQLAAVSLVEKNVNESKLLIAFDSTQIAEAEALGRVDRPVGFTASSTPSTPPGSSVQPGLNPMQIASKGRLAVLAVFGSPVPEKSFSVAERFGFIRQEVVRVKLLHSVLATLMQKPCSLEDILQNMLVDDFLKIIGCGCEIGIMEFADSSISELSSSMLVALTKGVPSGLTPVNQLAKLLVPLLKLKVVAFDKSPTRVEYTLIETNVESFWNSMYSKVFKENDDSNDLTEKFAALGKRISWKTSKNILTSFQRNTFLKFLNTLDSNTDVVDAQHIGVQQLCESVKMVPSTVLKFLAKLQKKHGKILFSNVLEARFSCPECRKIFYQWTSMRSHLLGEHQMDVPNEPAAFIRSEYAKKRHRKTMKNPENDAEKLAKILGLLVDEIGIARDIDFSIKHRFTPSTAANIAMLQNMDSDIKMDDLQTRGWMKRHTKSISRLGRTQLFGKWSQVDDLVGKIGEPFLTDKPDWHKNVFNEWGEPDDTETYSDLDDDGVGIKKHLQLLPCDAIDRVVINKGQEQKNSYIQYLVDMHNSGNSYIWNPTKKSERNSEYSEKQNHVSSWTDIHGNIDKQCLADILLHIMVLIELNPGIDTSSISQRIAMLPEHEVGELLQILLDQNVIGREKNEFFFNPINM